MDKFLDDEIVYIENNKIDIAFGVYKDKPNETKRVIKEFIKQLKFFTNSDFAFIDVHNEKLFYQNFEVLLKIAKMIQDIKLTQSEENQFLGDMFELFLDQGVKQSEGQYFTPMPIVRFIINSLPKKEKPNVIDYACGAGHFLNEYALQNKEAKIVGIEKEYRLSKVAKVSSFMYGNDIEVIYADALSQNDKIKDNSFDILIANPPYSVKGFLDTLGDDDKNRFELINEIDSKSYSKNGAIECFFVEKAKQLLQSNGVAGIIVPSSILNKDNPKLYITTREIILANFDIVAICEFGSGTFGKTGTNTITLFLRRIDNTLNLKQHFINIIEEWFREYKISSELKHEKLVENYCNYLEYDYNEYENFFRGKFEEFAIEILKEYKIAFEKDTITRSRKNEKYYKKLLKNEQLEIEKKEFIKYVKNIEKEKILYFALATKQKNDVVIVKSPNKTDKLKKFLGYEWGTRKGSEGIHYLTSNKPGIDEEIDEENKVVLESLEGIKDINTPLYNPQNSDDENKINKIIKNNFEGINSDIPDNLKEFVTRANLVDMIDFKKVSFNKAINLNPNKKIEIKSRWEVVKLFNISDLIRGVTYSKKDQVENSKNKILTADNVDLSGNLVINKVISIDEKIKIKDEKRLKKNDIFICLSSGSLKHLGKMAFVKKDLKFYSSGFMGIIRTNSKSILSKYLFELLMLKTYKKYFENLAIGSNINNLSSVIKKIPIPLPPLDIQEKIVKECEIVDNEVERAKKENGKLQEEIKNYFQKIYKKSDITYKLNDENIFNIFIGKRVLAKDISQNSSDGIRVYSANVYEPFGYTKKEFLNDFNFDNVLWGIDGNWMVNYLKKDIPFYPTDHCGVLRIKTEKVNYRFLAYILLEEIGRKERFSRSNRASTARIKALCIKAPKDYKFQQQIVSQIEKLEKIIDKNNQIIDSSQDKKEKIVKNYI